MDTQQDLIGELEAFCRHAGIAETTFKRQVVNDGKSVGRLRNGKGVSMTTVARVPQYLSETALPENADSPSIPPVQSATPSVTAPGAADQKAEGITICAELMQRFEQIPGVAGVHLVAPIGLSAIPAAVKTSGLRMASAMTSV